MLIKEVTLRQIVDAAKAIKSIGGERASPKFSYAAFKNKANISAEMAGIIAAESKVRELEKKRMEYLGENCAKDKSGNAIIVDDHFTGIDEKKPEFIAINDALKVAVDEYNKFLETKTEIDFHIISFEELPEKISPKEIEGMSIFITEPKKGGK